MFKNSFPSLNGGGFIIKKSLQMQEDVKKMYFEKVIRSHFLCEGVCFQRACNLSSRFVLFYMSWTVGGKVERTPADGLKAHSKILNKNC